MAKKQASKGRKKTIKVDFEGVESGGTLDEGSHIVEIVEAEIREGSSGHDYINLKLKATEDDEQAGRVMYHTCSLQPQALFNLRNVLQAIGHDVPNGMYEFDPDDMVGGICKVEVIHEKYEGKDRARAVSFDPMTDEDEEEEEEKPAKGKKAKPKVDKKKAKKEEDEEEDDEEEEEEEKPAKKAKPDKKAGKKDEDEEDEEEEEKKPKKGKKEAGFEVGQKVSFEDDDGDELTGKITEIDGDTITVKVGKEEWELEAADLTAV